MRRYLRGYGVPCGIKNAIQNVIAVKRRGALSALFILYSYVLLSSKVCQSVSSSIVAQYAGFLN